MGDEKQTEGSGNFLLFVSLQALCFACIAFPEQNLESFQSWSMSSGTFGGISWQKLLKLEWLGRTAHTGIGIDLSSCSGRP